MSSYQMSIDDIAYAEKIAELPGRTAFIDECGGFGFDFEKVMFLRIILFALS